MDLTWAPAFIGLAGGALTYFMSWRKERENEKRFLTKDAVEALTVMLNQTNAELANVKAREVQCQAELTTLRQERNQDRQFIYDLQHRVHELEAK